ncbi:LOG family protein [Leekyejoonella antrihumi]|uniref:Rossmann fold nucleotide-binding protein n=1 Tax=Leekyejoonella antrihumi TaxID=1660198 RepID=A0A563DZ82_9MICO|nr:LOG family protein [Leekyejoonella antrihumi]TWP35536.1 Rossmann fold nucleotide-binding protein [Leekyejoonella antrihumi]
MMHPEIATLAELDRALTDGRSLRGLRLQDLDLRGREGELLAHRKIEGLVVLGGRLSPALDAHLRAEGALIFPTDPGLPVNPYRAHLYRPTELYNGLVESGYAATPDAHAYAWSQDPDRRRDAYATLITAIHDDSILDALDELVVRRSVVGVMGGHAERRGTTQYARAAHLGLRLADRGFLVATGGGPGSMEATNLGAFTTNSADLDHALTQLARAPEFADGIDGWALPALRLHHELATDPRTSTRSLGVPTWFYGHEPPNLFGHWIAKFFSNAIREDILLARCDAGIIVLPGAAGTVQEIFQTATHLYYGRSTRQPPLVLVGHEHWTTTIPAWDVLQRLADGRAMSSAIHLVDTVDDALDVVGDPVD